MAPNIQGLDLQSEGMLTPWQARNLLAVDMAIVGRLPTPVDSVLFVCTI